MQVSQEAPPTNNNTSVYNSRRTSADLQILDVAGEGLISEETEEIIKLAQQNSVDKSDR